MRNALALCLDVSTDEKMYGVGWGMTDRMKRKVFGKARNYLYLSFASAGNVRSLVGR